MIIMIKYYLFCFVVLNLVLSTLQYCQSESTGTQQIHNPNCEFAYCRYNVVTKYLLKVSCQNTNLTKDWHDDSYTSYGRDHEEVATTLSIEINESNTKTLVTNTFSRYSNLTSLKIQNSDISNILPGAFSHLDKLTELILTHNHINEITSVVFNNLLQLKTLDLSFNEISTIDKHAFYGLTLLEKIQLNDNRITEINFDIFNTFTRLNFFDLSHNHIYTIKATMSMPLSLKQLNLGFNKLTNITNLCDFVHHLDKLTALELSYNNLEEYEKCLIAKNLEKLLLSSVGLDNINFLENEFYNKLLELDVSSNNISSIGQILTNLTLLQNLNLSNNSMQQLPVGCLAHLRKLRTLNLSHNDISELQLGVFQDLSQLENLDLSFNNLKSLNEHSFYVLTNLKTLKVDNNHIAFIDVDILTRKKSITQISLDNNDWKCHVLAEIVHKFEQLKTVTIKNTLVREQKNIHGITCVDDEIATVKPLEFLHSGTTTNNTLIKQQLLIPNLDKFDKDFKKTAFFEMLQKISTGDFVDIKRFDDNFKNTDFYNFIKDDLMNNNFSAIIKRFDGAFANSLVYKSLQKEFLMKKLEELAQKNLNGTTFDVRDKNGEEKQFQKYLDDGFRNSTFYKYFEQFSEKNNDGVAEKLVQNEKNMVDYTKHMYTLQIFLVLLLALVVFTLWYEKYQNYRRKKFNANRNDDTASGILMT